MGKELRRVRVMWTGPYTLDEVLQKNDPKDDFGVYQVYGQHVVFGSGSLLYIGKACDQTFAARFQQHTDWLKAESDVSVRSTQKTTPPTSHPCPQSHRSKITKCFHVQRGMCSNQSASIYPLLQFFYSIQNLLGWSGRCGG